MESTFGLTGVRTRGRGLTTSNMDTEFLGIPTAQSAQDFGQRINCSQTDYYNYSV